MSTKRFIGTVVTVALVLFWLLIHMNQALAHTPEQEAEWYEAWNESVRKAGVLSPALLDELREFRERHEVAPVRPQTRSGGTYTGMGQNVAQWRPLVAAYGGWNVDVMLCLMGYESGGNPNATNPSSGAAGLLQVMPFWWDHYGGDRFDPATNVDVAHRIWLQQGYAAWSPWNRGLCR